MISIESPLSGLWKYTCSPGGREVHSDQPAAPHASCSNAGRVSCPDCCRSSERLAGVVPYSTLVPSILSASHLPPRHLAPASRTWTRTSRPSVHHLQQSISHVHSPTRFTSVFFGNPTTYNNNCPSQLSLFKTSQLTLCSKGD